MESEVKPTPVADCVTAMVAYERETRDGLSPCAIRLGRVQRGMLNQEKRGARGYSEIVCPNMGEFDQQAGTYLGLPVYVVDDQSVIEIVLEKDKEEDA